MTAPSWRARVDTLAPTVLVIGGFLTAPPMYRPFVRRLRARGAARVVVANVWTPDWLLAAWRGLGPILTRSGRALLAASAASSASPRSLGAPVLVVGHSAGGMVARLLTAPEPFGWRRLGGAQRMGAIVTLGTPHVVSPDGEFGGRVEVHASAFAERVVPGATFAPRVGYLSVASRAVVARRAVRGPDATRWRLYQGFQVDAEATTIAGDGLVPVRSALLAGAHHLVLETALHGQGAGAPWYGAEPEIERWWPLAIGVWREALRARVAMDTPASTAAPPPRSTLDRV